MDRTPPEAHLTIATGAAIVGPTFVSPHPNFTVTVTAFDALTAHGMAVQLQLRSGTALVETRPNVSLSASVDGTRSASVPFSSLADRVYVLEAQVHDGADNAGALETLTVVVDTTAPRVSPWRWPAYFRADALLLCAVVEDAAADACNVTAVTGGSAPTAFVLNTSVVAPGASVFCGALDWFGFQGNASVVLTATDPAGNWGTTTVWLVRDAEAPVHVAALVASASCTQAVGTLVCRSTAGVAVDVSCGSGGAHAATAPCAVEWAVAASGVLQQGSCGATSASNASVPSGAWARVGAGTTTFGVGEALAAVALEAGGDRLAVRVAVHTRAVDDAGGCPLLARLFTRLFAVLLLLLQAVPSGGE